MADQTEGQTDLNIKVDLKNIRLRNRDLVDFEKLTGITVKSAFEPKDGQEPDPPYIAGLAMVYVLARQHNPDLEFDDVLDADFDNEDLAKVGEAVGQLLANDPTPAARRRAGKPNSAR